GVTRFFQERCRLVPFLHHRGTLEEEVNKLEVDRTQSLTKRRMGLPVVAQQFIAYRLQGLDGTLVSCNGRIDVSQGVAQTCRLPSPLVQGFGSVPPLGC